MYLLFALSMVVFVNGLLRRAEIWGVRWHEIRAKLMSKKLWEDLWTDVFLQRRVNKDKQAKIFHSLIFWGFLFLLFTTTIVFLDHDLGLPLFRGNFYLFLTLGSELFGVGLFIGVLYAYTRRYFIKPDNLHSSPADVLALGLLALMVVQGFCLEALRLHAQPDPWAHWSPIGLGLSYLFSGISPALARALHYGTWWFHTATVFVFIALIPYTKFIHIFSSSANLLIGRSSRRSGTLPYDGDIEKLMDAAQEQGAEDFSLGIETLKDLSYLTRLRLDACTGCGRCQAQCPAYNSGKPLSPKWLILDSRDHMLGRHLAKPVKGLLASIDQKLISYSALSGRTQGNGDKAKRANNPLVQESAISVGLSDDTPIASGVIGEDVFWACTTCGACVETCPVGINHIDYIVQVRRGLALMQGKVPSETQSVLHSIESQGSPFGRSDERFLWANGVEVPLLEPGQEVDILYWVGCLSAFDKRKQSIARSMATILNASKESWAVLGSRECCTGDPARRLGEENLFQTQAKKNLDVLASMSFKRLLTTCPHCFNTFKNEYSDIGPISKTGPVEVIHHTELIAQLLDSGRIKVKKHLDCDMTYHDPCYLARHNGIVDQPRSILSKLSTNGMGRLKEMSAHGQKGLCCGAGGGHFFMDMKIGERINNQRVDQAANTGAGLIISSCPFCLHMLEDGIGNTNRQESMAVKDIAELVAQGLQ